MQYPITCPQCGKKFNLDAPDESKLVKHNFICNRCGFKTPFVKLLPHLEQYMPRQEAALTSEHSQKTHISQPTGAPAPKTKISAKAAGDENTDPNFSGNSAKRTVLPLYFEVEGSGRKLLLSPGSFTLGRDSNDSAATIKVAPDPYMSRQCARLDVNLNGNTVRVEITPLKSTNPVRINNVPLAESAAKALKLGDAVLLGNTTITLKLNK